MLHDIKWPSGMPPEGRSLLPSKQLMKVISYNILAPRYAGFNSYCPPQHLAWEYRREGVLRELTHHGADLLGLQECDQAFYGCELRQWLERSGMQGEYLAREVGPVAGPKEGIALLWRVAVWEAVAVRRIVFADLDPRVAGLPAEVACTLSWSKVTQLGEGAVMALLRHRPTGQLVACGVTHLFWNPAYPDVKALQAALLCGSLTEFAASAGGSSGIPGEVPVLLCGDFNSLAVKKVPDRFDPQVPPCGLASGVYTLLSHGSLPPDHPDHPATRLWAAEQPQQQSGRFPALPLTSSGLQLASVCAEVWGREPPLTTRTAAWAGCLDYVWMSRQHFTAVSALSMPYGDGDTPPLGPSDDNEQYGQRAGAGEGRQLGWCDPLKDIDFQGIPDESYPSDHLAVGGQVLLLRGAGKAT